MEEASAVARAKGAIEAGDVASLEKELAAKEVHPDERIGSEGFSLIHWACFYGRFEVRALSQAHSQMVASTFTNAHNPVQVLQKLLLLGGSVELVEKHGWTPAHVCAIRGENTCLQVPTSTKPPQTMLLHASWSPARKCVYNTLCAGADV